jgi:hypothetical protein
MEDLKSRERKAPNVFVPLPLKIVHPAKVVTIIQGPGVDLGSSVLFCNELNKIDDETIKVLHHFLFGMTVKKEVLKRNIKKFSGFAIEASKPRKIETLEEKRAVWTIARLRSVLFLCGLEKSGTREELVVRLVDFMCFPVAIKRKAPVDRKRKKQPVGKVTKQTKIKKRRCSVYSYSLFVQAVTADIKAANPEAKFADVSRLIAARWKGISVEEKEVSLFSYATL